MKNWIMIVLRSKHLYYLLCYIRARFFFQIIGKNFEICHKKLPWGFALESEMYFCLSIVWICCWFSIGFLLKLIVRNEKKIQFTHNMFFVCKWALEEEKKNTCLITYQNDVKKKILTFSWIRPSICVKIHTLTLETGSFDALKIVFVLLLSFFFCDRYTWE